jgi:maltooligosyltrehalose trehalohydrolase
MVFLDVVYNHFGPDGNYLPTYSPVFTDRHKTPWGNAVNYEAVGSGAMREFVIANAEYWIEEFHLDGLRLDAVHAMLDDSEPHVLEEIAARVRAAEPGRMLHLMIENEENRASLLSRNERGEPVAYTAQWNDDLHHVLHCAASGESSGYYADYAGDTERLGRALAEGFAFQGEVMPFRGRARGEPSRGLPPTAFVSFIQNHDHVGNRAFGDRLTAFSPEAAVRAVAAVYLLLPQIPMLFMGEEFAAPEPFLFFCDFEPELAKAVSEGRRAEFKKFPEFADPQKRDHIPDPSAEQSFRASKLDWRKCEEPAHAAFAEHYRALLTIRHSDIVPRLAGAMAGRFEILGDGAVSVRWKMGDGTQLQLIANLADRPLKLVTAPAGRKLWSQGATEASMEPPSMQPWGVLWTLNERGAA